VVTGAVFARRQLTLEDPLLDLRLFRLPSFSASLATYGLGAFIVFGGFLYLPQFLQLVEGLSPVFTLTADLVVGSAPPERVGAASGMAETGAEFGGAPGIAVFGTIGTALYRGAMNAAIPSDVPAEAASAARNTLGGAIALASQLPEGLGSDLILVAQDAFLQGLHFASTVSAVGSVILAVFVAIALRNVRLGAEADESNSMFE
jgi:hypothetical protein